MSTEPAFDTLVPADALTRLGAAEQMRCRQRSGRVSAPLQNSPFIETPAPPASRASAVSRSSWSRRPRRRRNRDAGSYIELIGNDRPGIIHDISRALAAQGINIEDLETDVTGAPSPWVATCCSVPEPTCTGPAVGDTRLAACAARSWPGELMVDLDVEPIGGE